VGVLTKELPIHPARFTTTKAIYHWAFSQKKDGPATEEEEKEEEEGTGNKPKNNEDKLVLGKKHLG